MSLKWARIIELPKILDRRGNLTFIEGDNHIPFQIARVYYLYDVPAEADRGGHGHKKLEQVVIPLSGSFEIILDDGFGRQKYLLNKPYQGLYIASMIWRELHNFSSGSVCLVLASDFYKEEDYYRDYQEFLTAVRNHKQ